MGFPTEHKDARDAYYHLRDFGQMNHAQAVYDLAETLRLVGEENKALQRQVEELEKKQKGVSYGEQLRRDAERRCASNRGGINE